ncbi:MAG: Replication factor C small subunit [Candidatus Aenigmarchaeota archaeon ex4484_56]|nr:MAG: Replication factor C small subunit [Candidatus Aenigmarchaeota archaeon ex4484_56]
MFELWTEKYRPYNLEDMVGQENIVKRLKSFVEKGSIPNLLFTGPPGTGKTTAAICLANELFGNKHNFCEYNASDERGIDTIRVKIKDFARTKPIGNAKFKIILLDEADALTKDAQQALRRTMENYSEICRFILDCNYSSKLIEPIQSRCVVFRFKPLTEEDLKKYIKKIETNENLKLTDDAIDMLFKESNGDLRRATNILQACASVDKNITENVVLEVVGKAKIKDVEELLKLAIDGNFIRAREKLYNITISQGVSSEDLLKQIYSYIFELDLPDEKKIEIIKLLAEYEFRIVEGSNPVIQLEAFLANLGWKK